MAVYKVILEKHGSMTVYVEADDATAAQEQAASLDTIDEWEWMNVWSDVVEELEGEDAEKVKNRVWHVL